MTHKYNLRSSIKVDEDNIDNIDFISSQEIFVENKEKKPKEKNPKEKNPKEKNPKEKKQKSSNKKTSNKTSYKKKTSNNENLYTSLDSFFINKNMKNMKNKDPKDIYLKYISLLEKNNGLNMKYTKLSYDFKEFEKTMTCKIDNIEEEREEYLYFSNKKDRIIEDLKNKNSDIKSFSLTLLNMLLFIIVSKLFY